MKIPGAKPAFKLPRFAAPAAEIVTAEGLHRPDAERWYARHAWTIDGRWVSVHPQGWMVLGLAFQPDPQTPAPPVPSIDHVDAETVAAGIVRRLVPGPLRTVMTFKALREASTAEGVDYLYAGLGVCVDVRRLVELLGVRWLRDMSPNLNLTVSVGRDNAVTIQGEEVFIAVIAGTRVGDECDTESIRLLPGVLPQETLRRAGEVWAASTEND